MINVRLSDGKGTNRNARITKQGQLITAPISYSTPVPKTINSANTSFNLVKAKAEFRVVITEIVLVGDRNVGVNDATVELYESSASDSTTVTKSIATVDVAKNQTVSITGLNWISSSGVFINIKSDDVNIGVVFGGYYIEDGEDLKNILINE